MPQVLDKQTTNVQEVVSTPSACAGPSQTPLRSENSTYQPFSLQQNNNTGISDEITANVSGQSPPNNTLLQFLSSGTSNVNTLNTTEHVQNVASSYLHFSTPSISKPLALGVDPKIKAKIWAQEYIDLGHLLNKNVSKVRFHAV